MDTNKSNFILLSWAIILMIFLSLFPFMFVGKDNKLNHIGLIFLLWSMSSSFVKGIGFIPNNLILKFFLGTIVSIITAIISLIIFMY